MFNNLRLAILDYPKLILDRSDVMQLMSDMLQSKQINFKRVDKNYVPMSGLDMVSTHFLIFDTSNIYKPKPILAIRNTYEDRTKRHNLTLPSEEYIQVASPEYQKAYSNFKSTKSSLVDCNAWFVDPNYTFKKTNLRLSEIGYFMLVAHTIKRGFDHWVGATNEKYKASRWAELTGTSPQGMIFTHPVVKDPHKLLLIDPINYQWVLECYKKYESLYLERFELSPPTEISNEGQMTDIEFCQFLEGVVDNPDRGPRESYNISTKGIAS